MWGHALAAVTSTLTSKAVEGTTEASYAMRCTSDSKHSLIAFCRLAGGSDKDLCVRVPRACVPLLHRTVFASAEGALERGDLKGAVAEVRRLEGPPAATAKGWLEAAEDRLLLDQMLTVATAASTIATAGLAPF